MRLAALADIHGNIYALEAVLEDLKRQAPDVVVVLGDSVVKFAQNRAVLDALDALPHVGIAGNMERGLQTLLGDECADLTQYDSGKGATYLKQQALAELGKERVRGFGNCLPSVLCLCLGMRIRCFVTALPDISPRRFIPRPTPERRGRTNQARLTTNSMPGCKP